MQVLEFWPDYGAGPLWTERGAHVDPGELDLDPSLSERLTRWNAEYAEDKIPVDGPGDAVWLSEGRRLLTELRRATIGRLKIITTEPWWAAQ